MSQTNKLYALEWEPEASWAENVSTFTKRLPILGPIAPDFKQDSIEPERAVQQLQGGTQPILGPKSGTFKIRLHAPGHGSATTGAVALNDDETFIGYAFGNPSLGEANSAPTRSAASGTTAGVGSTATNVVTAASATFAKGSLALLGTRGDAKGGGKFYQVASHVGTALALRHATQAGLASGDAVRSAVNFYFPETITNTACKGLRFRFLSGNKKYVARGCWVKTIALVGTDVAGIPIWELDIEVSEWDATTGGTFPSATAVNTLQPAPVAGGALQVQDLGDTTRNERNARAFKLTIELGIAPLKGHGGVWPYQTYVGCVRTSSTIRASWIETAGDGLDTWETKYLAGTAQTITFSASTTPGSALGIGLQNFKMDKRPVQIEHEGVNSVMVDGVCRAGTDTSTELSQAAAVIAYA